MVWDWLNVKPVSAIRGVDAMRAEAATCKCEQWVPVRWFNNTEDRQRGEEGGSLAPTVGPRGHDGATPEHKMLVPSFLWFSPIAPCTHTQFPAIMHSLEARLHKTQLEARLHKPRLSALNRKHQPANRSTLFSHALLIDWVH